MKNPLFYSSLLFALPGFYAYERGVDPYYLHHLLMNSFVSANHWNDPKDGWRKKIDVMYATYSFLLFFFKGVKYIKNTHLYVLGYTGVTLSLGSFALSNYYWKKKKTILGILSFIFPYHCHGFAVPCREFIGYKICNAMYAS